MLALRSAALELHTPAAPANTNMRSCLTMATKVGYPDHREPILLQEIEAFYVAMFAAAGHSRPIHDWDEEASYRKAWFLFSLGRRPQASHTPLTTTFYGNGSLRRGPLALTAASVPSMPLLLPVAGVVVVVIAIAVLAAVVGVFFWLLVVRHHHAVQVCDLCSARAVSQLSRMQTCGSARVCLIRCGCRPACLPADCLCATPSCSPTSAR